MVLLKLFVFHLQLLQELLASCQHLDQAMKALWIDPSTVIFDPSQSMGSGTSSTVYRGTVRGSPAAIKVYDRMRLGPAAGGAASIDQLMSGVLLRRELSIIARANMEFHHVCR
jgi:hypothetical protein